MDAEPKVALDAAELEFQRFCDAMDLDVDPAGMDDEDKASFDVARRRFVRAVMAGHLVVNESGEPVYTPKDGNPITFYEPKGAAYMAMDQKREGHTFSKAHMVLAEMTKQPPQRFAALANRDYKVVSAILSLFLGG